MEPRNNMSRNSLAAERWLDDGGSFSSEAVARVQNTASVSTASGRTPRASDVERGFTRRCGKRDPVDWRLCMHAHGHEGRHGWEPRP
jgi:hypothetical protein